MPGNSRIKLPGHHLYHWEPCLFGDCLPMEIRQLPRQICRPIKLRDKAEWFCRVSGMDLTRKMKIFNAVITTTLLYVSECWMRLATDLAKLEVFQMSCLRRILGITRCDQLQKETICHRCMEQPTVGKCIQWNHLQWFRHVCRMDNSCLLK